MNTKITVLAFLFLTTFGIGSSLFAMQAEDHLTNFFKTNCPLFSNILIENVVSSPDHQQAQKDLCSLVSTSNFFKNFFQGQESSIELLKYIHKSHSLSLEEMLPFLFLINSKVACYYYARKYTNESEQSPFSEFLTSGNPQIRESVAQAIAEQYKGEDSSSDKNFECSPNTMRFLARSWKFLSDTDSSCPKNICSFFSLEKALSIFDNALADTLAKELSPFQIFNTLRQNHALWLISLLKLIDEEKLTADVSCNTCLFDILDMKLQPEKQIELAKTFIKWGADVNSRNFLRRTPLHRAAQKYNSHVMEFLLSKGANPHLIDLLCYTPFESIRDSSYLAIVCKVLFLIIMLNALNHNINIHDTQLEKAITFALFLQGTRMILNNARYIDSSRDKEHELKRKNTIQILEEKCGMLNHDFGSENYMNNKIVNIFIREGIEFVKFTLVFYVFINSIYFIS
ncbi:hypothetical protein H0X06_03535 [Candidatus Dependentiae bacterium]|nr:hypothetical protein [Candidatus Dependentiae bacterium]